jgi:hypothetical protein
MLEYISIPLWLYGKGASQVKKMKFSGKLELHDISAKIKEMSREKKCSLRVKQKRGKFLKFLGKIYFS